MVLQSVWLVAERGDYTVVRDGGSAEELHSVERGKRICEILCSRPVSGL